MKEDIDVKINRQSDPYIDFPDVIIHTSWQTNVDKCTTDPHRSRFICMEGLDNALRMHRDYGSHIIFISSSYVFDGSAGPYDIHDVVDPMQDYGRLKVEAEDAILTAWKDSKSVSGHAAVIRTDALYDKNKKYQYPNTTTDQVSNPTYLPFLAEVVAKYARELIADGSGPSTGTKHHLYDSVYHVTGPETMSRYEFVTRFSCPKTRACLTKDLNLPAARPRNSALVNSDDFISALGVKHVTLDEAVLKEGMYRER